MLTAAQCETVAYSSDNGPLCETCARAEFGELHIDRAREGLNDRGLIQYVLGEYQTHEDESYLEYLSGDHGDYKWSDNGYIFEDGYRLADDDFPPVTCAECGDALL